MAKQGCSREGCESSLPEDEKKIPAGWTILFAEEYKEKTVLKYFIYICPQCTIVATTKQAPLFNDQET